MTPARPTSIYIVDDSVSIRSRLAEMLATMGDVRVVGEAASAADAVEGILHARPDSVLLDLHLGGRSGMEVLQHVRRAAPEIVFVVLTNHSEPQYRRACARAGAAYFLDKSTEFDRVRSVIAEIAATHH
ncbi:MAG TPA: response regulator [Usitatibacter sp.]|nr:response regulator [Usitatibacter sp.]